MKLIKKIAAIMFAFMMVVSMSCNVKADEGTSSTTKGTITISNAIPGQTYKIYKILDLESYSPKEENGKEKGNFAYKPSSEWANFIKGENVKDKYFTFDGEYVSWKENASVEEFAKQAILYANKKNQGITANDTKTVPAASAGQTTSTLTFDVPSLGYYLVDSSVGTLCSLDTTKPAATIQEKNGVPSVDKIITSGGVVSADGKSNSASIGDKVYFKTTITIQPGAQNYVLHDKMTEGLTFDENSVNVSLHKKATSDEKTLTKTKDYSVDTTNLESTGPKCTFHINFTKELCDGLKADDTITVTYSATLNENAVIAGKGYENETWLKYGDSQNTQHKTTTTKTFEMNVFKFYIDKNDSNTEKGLAGATFKLTKDSQDAVNIGFVKTSNETDTDDVYRVAKKGETGTVTTITSPKSGKFTIQGLGAGTYYLTETQQPDGYNKLSSPVKVEIKDNGDIYVDGSTTVNTGDVKVENKTGTVLPSTGGMGTTMIYLVGAVLVLGSGVVLATKRRVKGK